MMQKEESECVNFEFYLQWPWRLLLRSYVDLMSKIKVSEMIKSILIHGIYVLNSAIRKTIELSC